MVIVSARRSDLRDEFCTTSFHGRRSFRPFADFRPRRDARRGGLRRDQRSLHGDVAGPLVSQRIRQAQPQCRYKHGARRGGADRSQPRRAERRGAGTCIGRSAGGDRGNGGRSEGRYIGCAQWRRHRPIACANPERRAGHPRDPVAAARNRRRRPDLRCDGFPGQRHRSGLQPDCIDRCQGRVERRVRSDRSADQGICRRRRRTIVRSRDASACVGGG